MIPITPQDRALFKTVSQGKLVKQSKNYNVFSPTVYSDDERNKISQSNPYANVDYRQSWMQSLLEKLGFRTNKDAYLESMALQSKEFDSQVAQKFYNEDYDSALSQAQREREAGLNPNLTGNVSSGDSSPMVDDGNPPVPPESDLPIIQQAVSFAGSVVSGLESAFSMVSGIVDISGKLLDNRAKKISQWTQEDNSIMDSILNILPSDKDSKLDYNQLFSQFRKVYKGRIKKRYFPDFVNRAFAFQNGLSFDEKAYGKRKSRADSRKGFYVSTSGSDYSEENEVMQAVSGELSDLALSTFRLQQESLQSTYRQDKNYQDNLRPEEIANKLEYEQNLNPSKIARNEMVNSDLDTGLKSNAKWQSDYQKTLNSTYKRIFDKLDRLEDNGNWFAPYAKLFISAFLLGNMPSIPLTVNTGSRTNIFQK